MRRVVFAALAVMVCAGMAAADGLPDPIISPRSGTSGSFDWYKGTMTLVVNAFDDNNHLLSNCMVNEGDAGGYICGTPQDPILATVVGETGQIDGHVVNFSGMDITNLLYTFESFQYGPFSTDGSSLMPDIQTIEPGVSALLSGGTIASEMVIYGPSLMRSSPNAAVTGFYNFFAGVNVPGSGQLYIELLPNAPVPEPGSIALLMSGIGALWFARKRWTN